MTMRHLLLIVIIVVLFGCVIACQSTYECGGTKTVLLRSIDIVEGNSVYINSKGSAFSVPADYDSAIDSDIRNMKIGHVYQITSNGAEIISVVDITQ